MTPITTFKVTYEQTPNPQSLKFVLSHKITSEPVNFSSVNETMRSPLARKIFGFPWAAGVFLGPDFVTVTKQEWVEWEILADPLCDLIQEHLERGEPIFVEGTEAPQAETTDDPNDSPEVVLIKRILRDEIRPAVAMDGGDISFDRFQEGIVYLHMKGACSGCPSSAYTLKEGIETRLKEVLPEIKEVVAI